MKLKSYLFIGLATFALASCDDDFGDWVTPANNEQGAIASFGNGSVTPVSTIDFRTLADDVTDVKVCNIVAPTSSDETYSTTYQIKFGDTAYDLTADGNMSRTDLENYVNNLWGKRPVERTTKAAIVATLNNGTTATRFTSDSISIVTIAKAPDLSSAYYVVGGALDWAGSAASKSQKFSNGDQDPYENPEFTITIPAAASGDTWFAIGTEEACDAITNNGDWSQLFGTTLGDGGMNNVNVTERYDTRANLGHDCSFKVPEGPKYIRVTINVLDQTYLIEPLNFGQYIYEIGNESGWSTSHPLYGANYDGNYLGYYYLNGEFKFKPNADNWDNDWEYNGEGKIADIAGGSNIPDPGAGYYRIAVNTADLTYSLLKVESISMIGTVQGNWDTDLDMTYNEATGNWEWTGQLNAGEVKFRVNHDWTYSWGGKASGTDYDNLTENNGQNLQVAEAGTYKVTLTVHQENGDCKVSIEKQ